MLIWRTWAWTSRLSPSAGSCLSSQTHCPYTPCCESGTSFWSLDPSRSSSAYAVLPLLSRSANCCCRVAIAIFKIHSAEILATDSASTFYVFITSLTSHMYGADKLLKVAFEDLRFIKRQDAERLRLKHVAAIEKALQANQSHH